MSEWIPSTKVDKRSRELSVDQQFFGPEAGRHIPARQSKRTTNIALPSTPSVAAIEDPRRPSVRQRVVRRRVVRRR